MTEKKEGQTLDELVTSNTKREEFVEMVEERLTPEEKTNLGENAANKLVESMSYLCVFAPEPATFNKKAFAFTGGFGLEEKEIDTIWNFMKRTGILKDQSALDPGRVSVSEKFIGMLADTSNGFSSDD